MMNTTSSPHESNLILLATAGDMDGKGLDQLVYTSAASLDCKYFAWQTLADAGLAAWDTAYRPQEYPEGRLFCHQGQLHWRQEARYSGGKYFHTWRLVYAGPSSLLVPGFIQRDNFLECCQAEELLVRLWGERLKNQPDWMEPRIPRRISYPAQKTGRWMALRLIRYRKNGQIEYVRWADLLPWKEER